MASEFRHGERITRNGAAYVALGSVFIDVEHQRRLRVARIVDPKRLELGKIEIVDADDCKKIDKPMQSAAY